MTVKLCTRAEALDRYMTKERIEVVERAREVGIGVFDPRDSWERMRNYEIEYALNEDAASYGDTWIVREWCPYDGIFCNFMKVAPKAELEKVLKEHRTRRGYVADFMFQDLREAIKKREEHGLSDTAYFYQGAAA
jgi:hypothetical protein